MRKLILETDSQGNVSVHLHGFKPPIAQDSDAGGSSDAPLMAHMLIDRDRRYICILPSVSSDSSPVGSRRRGSAVAAPSKWEYRDGHYVISASASFAMRLYQLMGWQSGYDYSLPGIPVPKERIIPCSDPVRCIDDSALLTPLFFDLGAADPQLPDTASFTEALPRRCFVL